PWPGGRFNHYLFDLNRDWSWSTQQETQQRLRLYREIMPHVHVDFHEMDYSSTYFFFPAAHPLHREFPAEVKHWGEIFARGNSRALDRHGVPYFTGESFDLFYPGYGDSWPTFNGAIGMTYEQAGHGRAGLAIRRPDGTLLTLADRARNHFLTSIATLETAIRHRTARSRDFFRFWDDALRNTASPRGYLIPPGNDPNRTARMVNTLLRQGVEVHRLGEPLQTDARPYYAQRNSRETFPAGTYFVSLNQPQRRLVTALLEPRSEVRDTFFYDVSAWSLPVAYGLKAYTTDTPLPRTASLVTEGLIRGTVSGGKATFAYLIPWDRTDAVKLAWQLLDRGFHVSVAHRWFETGGRRFEAGTIVAFVGANPDSLHDVIPALAATYGVDVFATATGMTDTGISLGSNRIRPLKRPEIAVITDAPVGANDFGELWFMFDREFGIPFTAIRAREFSGIQLSRYSVIIFPDGGEYRSVFDTTMTAKLKRWVEEGGVVIGIEGGARFLTKNRSGITPALVEDEKKNEDKTKAELEEEKARAERIKQQTLFEKQESDRLERIPGTIFRALVDTTHPIGFGYEREVYVLKGNAPSYQLLETGHTVVRYTKDSTSVSGYALPARSRRIAGMGAVQEYTIGNGKAVLFGESITFRMFWTGFQKMLFNAVLFLPPVR
ncbi:MAG: hypothetical protein WD295_05570, partial [Bacteroidota bacterium]